MRDSKTLRAAKRQAIEHQMQIRAGLPYMSVQQLLQNEVTLKRTRARFFLFVCNGSCVPAPRTTALAWVRQYLTAVRDSRKM